MDAIITCKSKDYLLGYVDCLIQQKTAMGIEKLEFHDGVLEAKEKNKILGDSYLDITCPCGFYINYKSYKDIPEKSSVCPLCEERYLIKYFN
jgi:hypothetical protein